MATANRAARSVLGVVTVVLAAVALVPRPYHRWWWWDVLMHALVAGLLAAWADAFDVPSRWAWPAFVAAMLAWEWVELSTRYLFSPTRQDLLADLTVNVVVFAAAWVALASGSRATGRDTSSMDVDT